MTTASDMTAEPYRHPAFPQPDCPHATLWRYMDGWKFEWLLGWRRLYMARADQLGDRLEGTSPAGHRQWWLQQQAQATDDAERAIIQRNERFLASFREVKTRPVSTRAGFRLRASARP
jgi:hypothetical protein